MLVFGRSLCRSPETETTTTTTSPAARVNSLVERAIQRHGSAEGALSVLMAQNVTLEDQSAEDRRTITDLKGKIPDPEKMVVLPKERAELLNKYETLKLTPEQVAEAVKKRDELQGTAHTYSIEKLSREGAPAIGFDPDATADLVSTKGLHLELREVEVEVEKNGKKEKVKQKVPFVRPAADEKAQLEPLAEYAKKLPAFELRGLQAVAADKGGTTTTGTPYPESRPTPSGDTKADAAATIDKGIREKFPTPSELRKLQTTSAGA